MYTDSKFEQSGSSNDLQIFVGASEFIDTAGLATTTAGAAGLLYKNVPSTDASTFYANITAMLKRTGIYATYLWTGATANAGAGQEAFGTAASVPGPTAVAGTSGPLATYPGAPPYPGANLDTLTGGVSGAPIKGMKIASIDVIYEVDTVAAALAQVGVTDTVFANGATPVVTNRIALGTNGLPTATNTAGKPGVTNVLVPTPAYPVTSDTSTVVNVNLTAGNGGTIKFYGVVLHVTYNLL